MDLHETFDYLFHMKVNFYLRNSHLLFLLFASVHLHLSYFLTCLLSFGTLRSNVSVQYLPDTNKHYFKIPDTKTRMLSLIYSSFETPINLLPKEASRNTNPKFMAINCKDILSTLQSRIFPSAIICAK